MFAMFGASVLVPFVFGINPAVVLFMNGLGTLLFILITKGRAPAYLVRVSRFLHRLELLSQNGDTVMHWEALLQSDSADVFYFRFIVWDRTGSMWYFHRQPWDR